jgi:RimJ/RimL family protein N-acetyltransferase
MREQSQGNVDRRAVRLAGMHVPAVHSRRLDLVSMSPAFLSASLSGGRVEAARLIGAALPPEWPKPAERQLHRRLKQLAHNPTEQPWLLRAMVLRDDPDRPLVGYINFHASPGPHGWVEVGYTVLPEFRRRGYAQEAVEALFDWASREHNVQRFRASVSPGNVPSLALVRKLGFREIGRQWDDEDGEELVFELDRSKDWSSPRSRSSAAWPRRR